MNKNFNGFIDSLKNSIKTWEYFVNWEKVLANKVEMEMILNNLNYLLGKSDLESEFKRLFARHQDIVLAFPTLLAVREKELEIYDKETKGSEMFEFNSVPEYSDELADKYFEFLEKTGLTKLFKEDGIKNLVDYVYGVEVGLDSNGRKNRGGTLMEDIVEDFVKEFCESRGFEYISQARATKIKENWKIDVEFDKSERSFDFAILNPETRNIKLVETNFYNGGGSKLKAVCGEFKSLYKELKQQDIDFIWITDGLGWQTARRPLEETYNHNEYVFNLGMLENNVLDELKW
jgi:hypothetical protein